MDVTRLAVGWVLCPGRHTLTRVYPLAEPQGQKAHYAYHRFFRRFHPRGVIPLTLDDTTFHKTGRKMDGAGWWRDAVRSTGQKVVHCFGLNLVVLCVRIDPPWGGEPLSLPINARLHRKGEETLLDQGEAMMREVAEWFPGRRLHLSADGFYATLAGRALPNAHLTSRMRSDAAIYAAPPTRRPHQKGRSRKKGRRLPTPKELAQRKHGWKRATVVMRGKPHVRLLLTLDVLWYAVSPKALVRLVISRDPEGHEEDDFLFTTDLNAPAQSVVSDYAGRWSLEDTFQAVPRRGRPAVLEGVGSGTSGGFLLLDILHRLALASGNAEDPPLLDPVALVSAESHALLRGRTRLPASRPVGQTAFRELRENTAPIENHDRPHKCARHGRIAVIHSCRFLQNSTEIILTTSRSSHCRIG